MDKEEAKEIIERFENYSKTGSIFTINMVSEVEKARELIETEEES